MKTPQHILNVFVWFAAAFGLAILPARGEPTTFNVDSTQSSLTVSATLSTMLGDIQLEEQGSGSLTTTYEGTIQADVTASSIEFTGGSLVDAQTNGVWEPGLGGAAGAAPADYAGKGNNSFITSSRAAMRNILVDLSSGPLPVTAGSFPAETLVFGFSTNGNSVLDYSFTTFLGGTFGSYALTQYSTNSLGSVGYLTTVGADLILTIPVDYTGYATFVSSDDFSYTLTGLLVAKATQSQEPLETGLAITANQLVFTINTAIGSDYTILATTNLLEAPTVFHSFTATENPTVITNSLPDLPQQFFQVRKD